MWIQLTKIYTQLRYNTKYTTKTLYLTENVWAKILFSNQTFIPKQLLIFEIGTSYLFK